MHINIWTYTIQSFLYMYVLTGYYLFIFLEHYEKFSAPIPSEHCLEDMNQRIEVAQ